MTITPDELDSLPMGAVYQAKEGQASATIKKTGKGYEITANCDSLLLLVTNYEKEVYHLNKENTALKTTLNEQKTVIENEPSGWQWFQIYGFRIYLLFTVLFAGYKIVKNKILKIWQQKI